MRKKKIQPEQNLSGPRKIRREALVAAMRRLIENEDFKLLESLWLNKRGEMLEKGKEKPSEAQWSVLKGFDEAVLEPHRQARLETIEDLHKQRAEELRELLAETEAGK